MWRFIAEIVAAAFAELARASHEDRAAALELLATKLATQGAELRQILETLLPLLEVAEQARLDKAVPPADPA